MITIKVAFSNGDSLVTRINSSLEEAQRYYIGQPFNLGTVTDSITTGVSVEQL